MAQDPYGGWWPARLLTRDERDAYTAHLTAKGRYLTVRSLPRIVISEAVHSIGRT